MCAIWNGKLCHICVALFHWVGCFKLPLDKGYLLSCQLLLGMKNICVYDEFGNLNQGASSDVGPSSGSLQNHDSSIQKLSDDIRNFPYVHHKWLVFPL